MNDDISLMNTKRRHLLAASAALALMALNLQPSTARGQGTGFTYQGRLNDGTNPANGSYELTLKLFKALTGGSQVGATLTNTAVSVSEGLFTIAADFGPVFDGTPFWLQIGVRTNGGGGFTALTPRQSLTPTPYALYSPNAGAAVSATTASGVAAGSVSGAGIQAGSITAANLNLGSVSNALGTMFWGLAGNAGTGGNAFLGTTDNQPFSLFTAATPRLSISNGGLVGIGTTSPAGALLEVAGDLRLDNNRLLLTPGTDTSIGLMDATNGLPFVPGGVGPFLFGFQGGSLGTVYPTEVSLAWDWIGNVWVSNNLATVQLNVDRANQNSGSVRSNALTFGSSSGEGIASRRTGTNNLYDLEFYTSFQNRMTINNGGIVGIGTTNPGNALLEVAGDVRLDGNRLSLSSGSDNANGVQYAGSGLPAVQNGQGPFIYGYYGGALGTVEPTVINLTWDAFGNVWVSNNLAVNGNLSLPATATFSSGGKGLLGGLTVDQNGKNVGNVNSNALVFGGGFGSTGEGIASKRSGTNPFDLEFFTGFNNRMTISQGGSVGIGTTAPANALLEVNGDIRLDGNRLSLTTGGDFANGLQYFSSGLPFVPGGYGPLLYGFQGGALGTLGPTEINLSWDSSGNIWVSNNVATAQINVDRADQNVGNVYTNALTFGNGSGEGIASKRSGTGKYDLEFFTGFNNQMTIANSGNVGINTTTPSETLEINGTSRIDNHDMYLRAGTDQNHGFGYRATAAGLSIDGPFIYGWSGGALGGKSPETVSLKWDWQGNAWVSNNLSTATLTIRGGSDLAEPFPVTGRAVEPGTVMVIDKLHPGQLMPSDRPYDTRVAGIISGAGGIKAGLELQQEGVLDQGQKVALSGRVYVQADASVGEIEPGDLLTTSGEPGCAMKVSDHARAQGAILGKAMTGLKDGKGLVLVLVTLQ